MKKCLMLNFILAHYVIKEGCYIKDNVMEYDVLQTINSNQKIEDIKLFYWMSMEKYNQNQIIFRSMTRKLNNETLIFHYSEITKKETEVFANNRDYWHLFRYKICKPPKQGHFYFDVFPTFCSDSEIKTINKMSEEHYGAYIDELIYQLLSFLDRTSFFKTIHEVNIKRYIKEIMNNEMLELHFFNKIDMRFQVFSFLKIFQSALCNFQYVSEFFTRVRESLKDFFNQLLKKGGDLFFDIRKIDKTYVETNKNLFILTNINMLIVDLINSCNLVANYYGLIEPRTYLISKVKEKNVNLKQCLIINIKSQDILDINRLKIYPFDKKSSKTAIPFFFDRFNNTIILDVDEISPSVEAITFAYKNRGIDLTKDKIIIRIPSSL